MEFSYYGIFHRCFSETTLGEIFDVVIELVAKRGRIFFKLFQNTSMSIIKGAGLVMRAIIGTFLILFIFSDHVF